MARVSTLCDCAVCVLSTVCVDLVGAVVFLVVLALVASKIGTDLSTNTSAVSNLDAGDLVADLDDLANNLVSYTERQRELLAPSSSDGVDIRCADTAGVNSNVDIVLFELLKRKL
jgi:DNA-binding MarR family transcriptional regulator